VPGLYHIAFDVGTSLEDLAAARREAEAHASRLSAKPRAPSASPTPTATRSSSTSNPSGGARDGGAGGRGRRTRPAGGGSPPQPLAAWPSRVRRRCGGRRNAHQSTIAPVPAVTYDCAGNSVRRVTPSCELHYGRCLAPFCKDSWRLERRRPRCCRRHWISMETTAGSLSLLTWLGTISSQEMRGACRITHSRGQPARMRPPQALTARVMRHGARTCCHDV
jgi:hypothetical protein